MKLPRMTTRRWMIAVAIVAIGLADVSHWRLSRKSSDGRPGCLPLFEIDPPPWPWPEGFDPYEIDASAHHATPPAQEMPTSSRD